MNTKSTPSPASSVPARNSKAHDHQYRQHKTWSTHATCEICGFAVSKSTLFLDQNVLDSQLSAELVKERRNPSVPAPAEDVAIVGFARGTFSHEGRIALLSCNHSQVVPESFTTADRVKCATCFPSPAEPVKVLGGEQEPEIARYVVTFDRSLGDDDYVDADSDSQAGIHQLRKELQCAFDDGLIAGSFQIHSRVKTVADEPFPHAAHLAKIQALTEAAKELLDASYGQFESQEAMQRLYDARAQVLALTSSLPSA